MVCMNKMVVTNWRTGEDVYLQARSLAAQSGISVNRLLELAVEDFVARETLGKKTGKKNIYDALLELGGEKTKDRPMGLSADDEIIYG